MQYYIIKFPDRYYLRIDGQQRYKTMNISRAYIYCPYDLALEKLNYMKKHYKIMKDCIVVDKAEEMKLNKINIKEE